MTSSLPVFEATIRVKSTHAIKHVWKREKEKNMEIQEIFT